MPRRKRPYVPKVKGGCYECSQRRINCDGARPGCGKCTSRGLECSGFETKFRFRNGLPRGERRAGRIQGSLNGTRDGLLGLTTFSAVPPAPILLDVSLDSQAREDDSEPQRIPTTPDQDVFECTACSSLAASPQTSPAPSNDSALDEEIREIVHEMTQSDCTSPPILSPRASLLQLEPWKEFLLTYFSNNIAPEMVVMDDDHNGWRHQILPMACADDLIMSAVLSASAFHLSSREANQSVADPHQLYGQAIRELRQRQDLVDCDQKARQAVILGINTLLVAVMINGCSDFPIIFQMLESALTAVGGESGFLDGGDAAQFFLRQIRKMRVYAAPLLSQDAGLHAIIYHGRDSFDCLHYYDQLHPTQSPTFKLIADLRQQAFDMYLDRVLGSGSRTASKCVMDRFIATMQRFTEGTLGEHVLVWPVFIAALESCSAEHREILEGFLRRQHRRNGFGNILRGLDLLKTIWSRQSNNDWPALLPEPQVFIM